MKIIRMIPFVCGITLSLSAAAATYHTTTYRTLTDPIGHAWHATGNWLMGVGHATGHAVTGVWHGVVGVTDSAAKTTTHVIRGGTTTVKRTVTRW